MKSFSLQSASLFLLGGLVFSASIPHAQAAELSFSTNESPAGVVTSFNYNANTLTVDYSGFMFCASFGAAGSATTVTKFVPKHGAFLPTPLALSSLTGFNYRNNGNGFFRGTTSVCPLDSSLAENSAQCGGIKNACLYADENANPKSDLKSSFRDEFEQRGSGSFTTLQQTTRPAAGSPNLVVTVGYTVPGVNQGTPAQSYVSTFTYDTAILNCPTINPETFFATSAAATYQRTYTCTLRTPSVLPGVGTPLVAAMLFPQPGTGSYTPVRDTASDNLIFVKM